MKNRLLVRTSILFVFMLVAASAFGTTYYIAASGADTNNGTAKVTPWLHAPGMTGCSNTCALTTPKPGDNFILKGGDSWHALGGGTPVGLPWLLTDASWAGTAVNRIYVGVDKQWFTGASWTRPKLNGDNPLSASAVASCPFNLNGPGVNNVMLRPYAVDYWTFDNLELLGLCQMDAAGTGNDVYILVGAHYDRFTNLYIHGWTHTNTTDGLTAFTGDSGRPDSPTLGAYLDSTVVDGTDSDSNSGQLMYGGPGEMHYCVFRKMGAGATFGAVLVHHNLFEYIGPSYDVAKHTNVLQTATGPADYYNNVIRHIPSAQTVILATAPSNGGTDHVFNNLIYDVPESNVLGADNFNGVNQTTSSTVIENNTINPALGGVNGGYCINLGIAQGVKFQSVILRNNHCISDLVNGTFSNVANMTVTQSNNILQTHAQAAAQGYAAGNSYAPTSPSNATVGAGINLTNSCSGNLTALCLDTTLGVSYDAVNHVVVIPDRMPIGRPASGAWNVGAYEFTGVRPRPNRPTILTATPH